MTSRRPCPRSRPHGPALAGVHSQVLQNVAVRLDLAFQAFFRRVKAGETPGYPRFRGRGRYDSITFPQVPVGCRLDAEEKRIRIASVGQVKILLHRPMEGDAQDGDDQSEQHGQVVRLFLVRVRRTRAIASDRAAGGH